MFISSAGIDDHRAAAAIGCRQVQEAFHPPDLIDGDYGLQPLLVGVPGAAQGEEPGFGSCMDAPCDGVVAG